LSDIFTRGILWQEGTEEFHTYPEDTVDARVRCIETPEKDAFVHEMLERIADKWTLLVLEALDGQDETRFSRLRARIGGISQKMLTKTLRQLERDGLVTRRVHPTVPPRVDYKLTSLGESLGESVCGIWIWVGEHMKHVERARRAYDKRKPASVLR
jgi:DNA-binding HxlR family transcriptional regulator